MPKPTHVPESPSGEERRRQVRVAFSPVRRPRLHLTDGVYDVLDASLDGLRVRHADPTRPPVGDRLTGYLEWPDLGTPMAVAGKVVRVDLTEFALSCEHGQLPAAHILAEAARRRDAQEAAAEREV
jgi:hypothetical protein